MLNFVFVHAKQSLVSHLCDNTRSTSSPIRGTKMNVPMILAMILFIVLVILFATKESQVENCCGKESFETDQSTAYHTIEPAADKKVKPEFTIVLERDDKCQKHKLVMLFRYVAKQMLADSSAVTAGIEFVENVEEPKDHNGNIVAYPRIYKIRRNGQVLEYTGNMDFAQLHDWVLNEALLF